VPKNKLTESIVRRVLWSHSKRHIRWYLHDFISGLSTPRLRARRTFWKKAPLGVKSPGSKAGAKAGICVSRGVNTWRFGL